MGTNDQNSKTDQIIRDVLKSAPVDLSLSDGFADMVTLKVREKMAWEQYMKEFLIYLGTVIGIVSTPLIVIYFYDPEFWGEVKSTFLSNPGIVTGIAIILIFILFTDRFLLRYFLSAKEAG